MAKEKRSTADLDAELAALEAELAALEGKPKKAKKKDPPPPAVTPAPADAASASETDEVRAEPKPEKKSRFAMPAIPKLGKKKAEPSAERAREPDVVEAMSEPQPSSAPATRSRSLAAEPSYDLAHWHQDGDAWVREVPGTPVAVVRRVLDESGNLVREEPASMRDVDEASGVKAERGLGRLLRRK